MQIIRHTDTDFDVQLRNLYERPAFDPQVEAAAAKILGEVRKSGDEALIRYARQFDRVELTPDRFKVSKEEIDEAGRKVSSGLRRAIRTVHQQVRDFALQRIPEPWSFSPRKGVLLGERFAPLDRVGCYVPGGTAPLVSTVLHTVTLANAAGVKDIVVVTPPQPDGSVHPAILYAAKKAGATEVYRLGGVYAIGALAFGTETIAKVEKIVGPGNAYVTAAKRQVYGYVAIDLVAGPSEIMIIADETANPEHVAADMLSQIEHGSGHEQAVLVTTHAPLITAVAAALTELSGKLGRVECIRRCLQSGVFMIEVAELDSATEIASRYAPEHLEIITRRAGALAKNVTAAGAVFLGPHTPEPVGDFVAGPSHVLPTGGAGRYFSGLTVEHFFRRMSVVNYQKTALSREIETIQALAEVEGLDAHGLSGSIRCKNKNED